MPPDVLALGQRRDSTVPPTNIPARRTAQSDYITIFFDRDVRVGVHRIERIRKKESLRCKEKATTGYIENSYMHRKQVRLGCLSPCRRQSNSQHLLQLVNVDDARLARERQRVSVALLLRYPVDPMIATVIGTKVSVFFDQQALFIREIRVAHAVLRPASRRVTQFIRPPLFHSGHGLHWLHRFHGLHGLHGFHRFHRFLSLQMKATDRRLPIF